MRNKQVKVKEYWRKKSRKISLNLAWYEILWLWIKKGLWYGFAVSIAVMVVVIVAEVNRHINPRMISPVQAQEIELKVPAILSAIADCETGDRLANGKAVKGTARQFGKSGQVLMTGNTNKSVDVGKFAINSVNYKTASKLGYDLTTEEGNTKFALYLYKKNGTSDWRYSKNCWK